MFSNTLHDLFVTLRGLEVSGFGDRPLDTSRGKLRGFAPNGHMKRLLILVDDKRSKSITVSKAVLSARRIIELGPELVDAVLDVIVIGTGEILPVRIRDINQDDSARQNGKIKLMLGNCDADTMQTIRALRGVEGDDNV